jgi:hypothetical protein
MGSHASLPAAQQIGPHGNVLRAQQAFESVLQNWSSPQHSPPHRVPWQHLRARVSDGTGLLVPRRAGHFMPCSRAAWPVPPLRCSCRRSACLESHAIPGRHNLARCTHAAANPARAHLPLTQGMPGGHTEAPHSVEPGSAQTRPARHVSPGAQQLGPQAWEEGQQLHAPPAGGGGMRSGAHEMLEFSGGRLGCIKLRVCPAGPHRPLRQRRPWFAGQQKGPQRSCGAQQPPPGSAPPAGQHWPGWVGTRGWGGRAASPAVAGVFFGGGRRCMPSSPSYHAVQDPANFAGSASPQHKTTNPMHTERLPVCMSHSLPAGQHFVPCTPLHT